MKRYDIKTSRASISLPQLVYGQRQEVLRIAGEDRSDPSWALEPDDMPYPPIVKKTERGDFAIVDGFHRIAGMVVAGVKKFPVIVVDAPKHVLWAIDANAEIGKHKELDAIYAAAGL